jgi:hypothetical protein
VVRCFGLGRSILRQGGLLNVVALIERADPEIIASAPLQPPRILIQSEREWEFATEFLGIVSDSPGVEIRAFGLRVDTADFGRGAYEVSLKLDGSIQGTESLWIVEEEEHRLLLGEETEQSLGVSFLNERETLSNAAFELMARNAIYQRLMGFLCVNQKIVLPTVEVSFEAPCRLSANLVCYLSEVFADQCRDVLLFGVKWVALRLTFAETLYRFSLAVDFGAPLTQLARRGYVMNSQSDIDVVRLLLEAQFPSAKITFGFNISDDAQGIMVGEARGSNYMVA